MSLPFDATLKDLVRDYLDDYQQQLELTDFGPLTPLSVDLSTLSAATDIALGEGDPPATVVDVNFQAGPDARAPSRVLMYNGFLHHRYGVPVHSVLVLLRREANLSAITGKIRYQTRRRNGKMDFGFEVVRLWRQPVQRFLTGGLGTLPLAPLCRLPGRAGKRQLTAVINEVVQRLTREATPAAAARLFTATYVLLGLRVDRELAREVFQGVRAVHESSTYQAILDEGRLDQAHKWLLRMGRIRFGPPDDATTVAVTAITDLERLDRMSERLLVVSSWEELLATP